ncbi:hypothetical protein GUJ93_ZPchr0003g18662 [Zizania palustris]|uniref:Helicase ATP-binding domain-containing protein n=1 Tax=Zizania palustris TaxID=103762 RepID=A0A8J5SDA0_ZIZPA|nr:hypothetical protein GUJ93_ZPchr0003g18662 [Zizania palustris]
MAGATQEHDAEARPPEICHQMPAIIRFLEDHPVVVVSAAPVSGKSSVFPRCLAKRGYGPVLCAQPRHFAVVLAAAKAGKGWDSDIVFTTTRQLLDLFSAPAPVLARFGTIVIDEANDRTLGSDVLLGMVKAAMGTGRMGQCKVVVCTAGGPVDGMLCSFFGAPIVASPRAAHAVDVLYARGPMLDMVAAVVDEVKEIHTSQPPGDVLVFLPENAHIIAAHAKLEQLTA